MKDFSPTRVNICLCYPDIYEVGFSHLGLKILYSITNNHPNAMADRVYAPWPDFADRLRSGSLPLFGLESRIPLRNFDIVGFTLQTELTFTNILYVLDLADIPLRSKERREGDPIILAGGPIATNPHPLSKFIDAFFIGDAEEGIVEIIDALKEKKKSSRIEKLEALGNIPSVFIPSLHPTSKKIHSRVFQDFNNPEKTHRKQLIPWLMPTHYRFVMEIMRGCSRGCRFCHAGMFYRPVRERDPQNMIKEIIRAIDEHGWNEVALTSLSSSDYSCITQLLTSLFLELQDRETSLSLPSLRVDSLDEKIIRLMNAMNQTGLTLAPEAGSQKLRDIINKNINEAEIINAVEIAYRNGWKLIKLYFMIGLPFEEDSDIQAIIELINKLIMVSKGRVRINITISPFVPKSFTPFQWSAMNSTEELRSKVQKIKLAFSRRKSVKISYHDLHTSLLECVLGRGGNELGELIEKAYLKGARFDSWSEFFDFSYWQQASEECGIDFDNYTNNLSSDQDLPWDNIDIGINRNFLLSEWKKAEKGVTTEDCRNGECSGCGVCSEKLSPLYIKSMDETPAITISSPEETVESFQYRVYYSKIGLIRFVGHLDLIRMTQNYLRASGLPLLYTQGFSIHPRLHFGPPLALGIEGLNEYYDLELRMDPGIQEISRKLKKAIPEGLILQKVQKFNSRKEMKKNVFQFEHIEIIPNHNLSIFANRTSEFSQKREFKITRFRKGKEKVVDLSKLIHSINWNKDRLELCKEIQSASVFEILEHVYGISRDQTGDLKITRLELLKYPV